MTTQPVSGSYSRGASLTLIAAAIGSGPVDYRWLKDGVDLPGARSATLYIPFLQAADIGSYSVVISNSAGSVTSRDAVVGVIPASTSATHAAIGYGYVPGANLTIANTLTYTGTPTALTWHVLLPNGWSYVASAGAASDTRPMAGATSVLDWTWATMPASPVMFTYTVNVSTATTGRELLVSLATLTQDGVGLELLARPDPLAVLPANAHRADTNGDFRLSLLELTRVIELYNTRNGTTRTGCYAVQAGSEDGFAPESARTNTAVVTLTAYHSGDSDRNGRLSLLELTRVIEFYNYRSGMTRTGQYHMQDGTEDGFAPGP